MIFWLDLETTGLDENKNSILEVALIVTEDNLIIRHEYEAVISQSQTVMDNMNDWCKNQHSKSGLVDAVWSDKAKPFYVVQEDLLDIMHDYYSPNDRPLLAGSSVHFDKGFLKVNWPEFEHKLSYRILDVTSYKEGFRRQLGIEYPFKKDANHRAMPDIRGSLEEYKFYMSHFKKP